MTLSEFKAWFSGFTEMMDGPPNADQWSRIQARIKEIDDKPIPVTVYREYVERFRPFWPASPHPLVYRGARDGFTVTFADALPRNGGMDHAHPVHDLGRAEYQSMVS
jgi:hypothetical protein